MTLAAGLTCGDCLYADACGVEHNKVSTDTKCYFYPIKFIRSVTATNSVGVATGLPSPALEVTLIEQQYNSQINGGQMPHRVLNPILALMVPTAAWPWWAVLLQGWVVALGAELLSTNVALKWLFIGCCVDVTFFMIRSWKLPDHYPLSVIIPDVLVRGIALWLSWSLSKEAAFQFEYLGFSTNPGELMAIFFITIVWASAGKSSEKLGLPWPKGIMFLFDKVHSSLDDVDLGDRAFSIFTKFTQKTDGNMVVTKKEETIVKTVPEPVKKEP